LCGFLMGSGRRRMASIRRKGGRAGTNGESEREDGGGTGDFVFPELADGKGGIGAERVEPREEFRVGGNFHGGAAGCRIGGGTSCGSRPAAMASFDVGV